MASFPARGHTHKQTEAAAVWTINHNLGRTPAVTVSINYEGKLQVVLPREIEVVDANQVVVRFSNPQSGEARLA